jgi:hypothetical protein
MEESVTEKCHLFTSCFLLPYGKTAAINNLIGIIHSMLYMQQPDNAIKSTITNVIERNQKTNRFTSRGGFTIDADTS